MNREELEERQLEIANRMKNIIWTVCGDYTLEAKPDVEAFLKSKYIALYDGIKQGAFAKYFEKEKLSMYLVKKVYLGAGGNRAAVYGKSGGRPDRPGAKRCVFDSEKSI